VVVVVGVIAAVVLTYKGFRKAIVVVVVVVAALALALLLLFPMI
jgi:hypothetical protein